MVGYQGAAEDPHKLALTNKLLEAVICEAKSCGTGQPVIIAGDFNGEPSVIAMNTGVLLDLESAFAEGRGISPSSTCRFDLDGAPGNRKDFIPTCPNALAASVACQVLTEGWFRPHFLVQASFGIGTWTAEVQFARSVGPLSPASWVSCPG